MISKDEERWWTAVNSNGRVGQIPVPYVTKVRTRLPCITDNDIMYMESKKVGITLSYPHVMMLQNEVSLKKH